MKQDQCGLRYLLILVHQIRRWTALYWCGLLLWAMPVAAAPTPTLTLKPIVLSDQATLIDAASLGQAWVDTTGKASFEQVKAMALAKDPRFAPAQSVKRYQLGSEGVLWRHLTLQAAPHSKDEWLIEVPLPLIDSVTLYQKNSSGQWVQQSAGDTIAVSQWPQAGRYPHFYLQLESAEPAEFFLRVKHISSFKLPLRLIDDNAYHYQAEYKYMLHGIVLGMFVLLCLACLGQYWLYRDADYAWYAAYGLLISATIAAYSGIAAVAIWPHNGWWSDASRGFFALGAASAACYVVRRVSQVSKYSKLPHHALGLFSGLGALLAIAYLLIPRTTGSYLVGVYVPLAVLMIICTSIVIHRYGDPVGRWLLAAHLPLAYATILTLAVYFGLADYNWMSQYIGVIALALEVPLTMVALNMRTRERHSAQVRLDDAQSFDPLTGVVSSVHFHRRKRDVIANFIEHPKEDAAVLYFELANYEIIKATKGYEVAEACLLHSVSLLRSIAGEDCSIGRIDQARFGLLKESAHVREQASKMAVRIIADGLIPHQYGNHTAVLKFHVAGIVLSEICMEAQEMDAALCALLDSMSPGTKRHLRFIEGVETLPVSDA